VSGCLCVGVPGQCGVVCIRSRSGECVCSLVGSGTVVTGRYGVMRRRSTPYCSLCLASSYLLRGIEWQGFHIHSIYTCSRRDSFFSLC
jgi:hypothetical protein